MSLGEWEDDQPIYDLGDAPAVDEDEDSWDEVPQFDRDIGSNVETALRPVGVDEAVPALFYSSVDEFVREFVCPVFSRTVGERSEFRWSARWWESAEAIIRLEAMWRAWEHLRLDPATGISVWLRDHADHHLALLMSPAGPFAKSVDAARAGEPLPYEPPPKGLFVDV